MYPENSSVITNDSEKTVYEWIKTYFPGNCEAYYGIRWKDRSDMESDFLIFHPGGFIILLEVKGGDNWIKRDGKWQYLDGEKPKTDPDNQFLNNKHSLIDNFNKYFNRDQYRIVGGLVFPEWSPSNDVSNGPVSIYYPEIGIDLYEWVNAKLIEPNRKYIKNGPIEKDILIKKFKELFSLESYPKLSIQLKKSSKRISRETKLRLDQSLDEIKSERQVSVKGVAGSGKTWLVKNLAQILYEQPEINSMLITCKSKNLAAYLKRKMKKFSPDYSDKCIIEPLYDYAERILVEHDDIPEDTKTRKDINEHEYWEDVMHIFSVKTFDYGIHFDAILIDEAQMLNERSWLSLDNMRSSRNNYMYIFYDLKQQYYNMIDNHIPNLGFAEKELKYNIRNTGNIFRFATAHYKDPVISSYAKSIDGLPVWLRYYSGEKDMKDSIVRFRKILIEQGVDLRDIILLTPKKTKSCLYQKNPESKMTIGSIKLVEKLSEKPNIKTTLFRTTIQNFIGREREVVILSEFDESVKDFDTLMYIGASRAKSLLIVLADQNISQEKKELYKRYSLNVSKCYENYENIMKEQIRLSDEKNKEKFE